jgi:beta-galactosidase
MDRRTFLEGAAVAGAAAVIGEAPAQQPAPEPASPSPRQRIRLDTGWRFHRGDIVAQPPHKGDDTYKAVKAGAAPGAASPKYDDSGWREVELPHDFVVEGPFSESENVSQGYRPKGVGWYRCALTFDEADRDKHLELQFDGIATEAVIWFNGNVVRRNWSAYDSAYIDITPFARFGGKPNVIAVRVDSSPLQGWWYEGGGLYRHAWLVKRAPVHFVTDGIYAHPRKDGEGWRIPIEATLANIGVAAAETEVRAVLLDPEGKAVARWRGEAAAKPLGRAVASGEMRLGDPRLWSVGQPNLYRVVTELHVGGRKVDEAEVAVGFRTQHFDPDRGFFLNAQPVKLKGVCIHQDHAGLGVALPDSIIDYRLRRLKELGCNAIRSSHNAPTRELLDAADRLGFLVMDENRLFNPSPDYMAMLEWMVRRDRNHPSVILWSVFNEEPLQGTREGYEMVRRMAALVKSLDDSRPVTAAMNNGMFEPVNVSQAVDVVGFNYQIDQYDKFHAANPTKPMTSSEDTSAVMTRGEYASDREGRHVLASYDEEAQPWGATHRKAWKAIATRPFLAGAFVWTGFDYRGEPQPFEWPTASSSFGIMDLCGFAKAAFFMHQAQWVTDRPVLHLVPHWNWPGREGEPIRVMAMSNAESVELRLNRRSLGEQKVDPWEMNSWTVPYAPGRLEAVARVKGRVVAHAAVETSGPPAALRLTPDRKAIAADGRDAVPVTVEAVDARGRAVPTAQLPVEFAIAGGRVIGVGNGDANSHEPEKAMARSLYNGLAQVIVQSERGRPGMLVLTAKSAGVKAAVARIAVG